MPKPESMQRAAQLWCAPQHSAKEMDASFAESIAALLDEVRAEERAAASRARGRAFGVTHGIATCSALAAKHAKAHGHHVEGEVTYAYSYTGDPRRVEDGGEHL